MSSRGYRNDSQIYVGNLPRDVRTRDIEDVFDKYGKIVSVDLKDRGDPPFAFVEFEDARDADDAVRSRDGYDFDGYRLRVEHPRGGGPRPSGAGPPPWARGGGDRGFGGGGGGGGRGFGGGGGSRGGGTGFTRSNYRVRVTGLPATGSWQDLKDHMREAGEIGYADVFKDGTGVVEFMRSDDMKYAMRKLNDTKFRSHEGDTSYINLAEDDDSGGGRGGSRGRSRSRSPKRRRSPSYESKSRRSPSYNNYSRRSGSGSRSRSPR